MTVVVRQVLSSLPGVRHAWPRWTWIRPLVYHRLAGSPVPPPHQVKVFEQIYTIELNYTLWKRAHDRFLKYPHVRVIQGDSGDVLPTILARTADRCLLWLDGHFSGGETARGRKDTPIVDELAAIRSHCRKDHIILIDDARLFEGPNSYPPVDTVTLMLRSINPEYAVRVVDDIIQAYLPRPHALRSWARRMQER